jgi:SAM-dependent methyltransferase
VTEAARAARRNPPLTSPTYAVRAPLARWLEVQAQALHARLGPYRLLDVGCGDKPYLPFFERYASAYVGVDVVENPFAELIGPVEALPAEDASFDVVLCAQVLEHCDDPARAVSELRRVTRPGGRVLASTHGVMTYHPSPADYWRWTHAGLERLFRRNADWSAVSVSAASGTTACLGMTISLYLDLLAKRAHVRRPARYLVAGINRAAAGVDARVPALRELRPGSLIANYHVEADA